MTNKQILKITEAEFITEGLREAEAENRNEAEGITLSIPLVRQHLKHQYRQLVKDITSEVR